MSDIVIISAEVVNDIDKAVNFFNVSDVRRKTKFIYLYLQDYYFKQKISFEKVIGFCRQIQNQDSSFQILLENLFIFAQALSQQSEARKLFIQLLQSLAERLTQQQKLLFFDQFDEDILDECGFIDKAQFKAIKRKINTELNFIQNKYGSMKDENEGFSKAMVEILEIQQTQSQVDIQIKINNIISLIGYFDLDPDRIVDLIVQSWIESPFTLAYVTTLKHFKAISVSQFLGKRFESLLHTIQNNNLGVQSTPLANAYQSLLTDPRVPRQNLMIVTALGIKYQLFEVNDIWKYLQPNDKDMFKIFEDLNDETYKYYKSFDQLMQVEELKEQSQGYNSYSDKLKKELMGQLLYNQKLWLMQALLQCNCIQQFFDLYKIFEGSLELTSFFPLKETLGNLIEWQIDHLYQEQFNSKLFPSRKRSQITFLYHQDCPTLQLKQATQFDQQFVQDLTQLLSIYHPYLGQNPMLFHKLFKVIQDKTVALPIITEYLLPALQGGDSLVISLEIWKHISQLDFRQRYQCYSKLKDQQQFQSISQIIKIAELLKIHIRSFFNKIDKENKDKMMMKFAKWSHCQPLIVMNQLRRNRLEISDNNNILVHALGQATQLSLDIMMFIFIQWLTDFHEETKIKDKDIDCKYWFKNSAAFLASCLRKYYSIDMQGLFIYMLEIFTNNQSSIKPEICILRELIEKMTGIVHISDLTPQQIQALAGGRYIQLETTSQTNEFRKSRKSSSALEQFFWVQTLNSQTIIDQNGQKEIVSLAFLILVVLCQQRSRFLVNYHSHNLKPLCALYDNYTCSVNQLTKCLLFQTDKPTHYAQLFPKNPLYRMVINLMIPFEIAFHIVRYSYKSLYNMTDEEFQEETENIKSIFDQIDPCTMYQNPDYNDGRISQIPLSCHTYIKETLWSTINPELFAIFWLLSLDNIYVPTQVYEQQIKWLQENVQKSQDNKDRQTKQIVRLQSELDNNKKRQEQFDKYLQAKKEVFSFKEIDKDPHVKFSQLFSQVCLLPRIIIDPAEAIYCAKFVQTFLRIGKLKQTYIFYIHKDIIHNTLTFLQCATEEESSNLSIFTQQLLLPFSNWNDEFKFKSDIKTYFDLQIENHYRVKTYITGPILMKIALFIRILKNNETQVRNALIFLKRIQEIFPATQNQAELVKQYLQDVEQEYGSIADIKTQIKNYHIDDKINNLPQENRGDSKKLYESKNEQGEHDKNNQDSDNKDNGKKIHQDKKDKEHRDKEKKKKSYERERQPKKQGKQ